jgi:hypothetical protein
VLGLAFPTSYLGDNREMRRGVLLTCLWVLGATVSVALAFAAVGRVASRVAPTGVARLSAGAVDRELGTTVPSTRPTITRQTTTSSTPPAPRTSTTRPSISIVPPPTSSGPSTSAPPPLSPPPTTVPHNTVTTSQGGTLWTRCSGADRIVYVAAVPRNEYERTRDVEEPSGIEQWFESDHLRSKIKAECSNGVVHAEVVEESMSGD